MSTRHGHRRTETCEHDGEQRDLAQVRREQECHELPDVVRDHAPPAIAATMV
jgi:hypothetical protein